jgi:predicted acyltransferase
MLSKSAIAQSSLVFGWAKSQAAHAAHTSIVLCGVITSLIFFNETHFKTISRRFVDVFIFATGLLIAGALLRPYYQISKIYATPTWCLYSAAICCIIFALLYWLIDLKKQNRWTTFFQPAAANPLLTYIIPPILAALFHYLDFFPAPAGVKTGFPGILWCLGYAIAIMWLVRVLNKLRIRLQL